MCVVKQTTARRWVQILLLSALLQACSATPSPVEPTEDFYARTQTQTQNSVTVTAGVPSSDEAKRLFNKPLYSQGVQPVWLKISNLQDEAITFLPVGLDPEYFSPIEAANTQLTVETDEQLTADIDKSLFQHGIDLEVPAGETREGFIFSSVDEGTKSFNVDLMDSENNLTTMTFFIPVPGLQIDHYDFDQETLYTEDELLELNTDELQSYIEAQTCCTTDQKAEGSGDPLNLVVIGDPAEVYAALIRAGWDETETVTRSSSWKTVKSFVSGGEYRYSPVSNLYVFGRPQDGAFQKARDNIHERNHLRLWMSPARYQGQPVWLGQISRDIGVRLTTKTITTHKIDPDVDEIREYLLENLAYSQSLEKFAYIGGAISAPIDAPRGNLTGDPYFTDGYRVVLWVTRTPVDISELEFIKWQLPYRPAQ